MKSINFLKKTAIITALLLIHISNGYSYPEKFQTKLEELNQKLVAKGVDQEWLWKNAKDERFVIYYKIVEYYQNMAENQVKRKEKDHQWYLDHFRVDLKIEKGKDFIQLHRSVLAEIEKKNGIDYELIVAILGMETNFADQRYRGRYNSFCTLVSHYLLIPQKQKFALNQLAALYRFSKKCQRSVYYFNGSFAGACGWAQFIPTSLEDFFIDSELIDANIDIYQLEDNLFSIENYLHQHGLTGFTLQNPAALHNAVYSYNHSKSYVKAVIEIYQNLKKYNEETPKK
ncbi:MAG: lytic murein transglycosylase [Spirochaetes bacterium]|nr:lytic murein transglycosylase [Spirochaetota bacterium]